MSPVAKSKTRGHHGLGNVRQRADGRWEARIRLPYGGQRSAYRRTKSEALAALADLIAQRDQPVQGKTSALTTGTWMARWIRDDVSGSTQRQYASINAKWITPAIGRIPLAKLTSADVAAMRRSMAAKGASDGVIRVALKVTRNGLSRALRADPPLVRSNVAQVVAMPTYRAPEIVPPTLSEVRAILAQAIAHLDAPTALAIRIGAETGLRQGEVLGLQWTDVGEGTITVRQALKQKTRILASTKTARSRRTLRIPADLVEALAAERRRQVSTGMVSTFVCAQADGSPLRGRHVLDEFHRASDLAGITRMPDGGHRFRFHDLRHAMASRILAGRYGMEVAQAVLGHARITTTVDTYGHLDAADMDLGLVGVGGQN